MRSRSLSAEAGFLFAAIANGAAVVSCVDTEDQDLRLAAPGELGAHDPAEDFDIDGYVGTYEFAGGEPERQTLRDAIESVAATFNVLARPIVRDKLTEANVVPDKLTIAADGGVVTITGATTDAAPLDGTPVKSRSVTGELMDLTLQTGAFLQQKFIGEDKGRVQRYELRGDRLTVHVRIFAKQLSRDLDYTLTFVRVS